MHFKTFTEKEKGTFSYAFWHWLAFNYIAIKLGVWKPRWLLHDIEKPFLKLFLRDYQKVRKAHKYNNRHHLQYGRKHGYNRLDWLGMTIDWECSRLTKEHEPRNARQEAMAAINDSSDFTDYEKELIKNNMLPILNYLRL